jgi:hypothetical protein
MRRVLTIALLASAIAAFSAAAPDALAAAPSLTVTSTLDGKKVLPVRLRWLATPSVPGSQVASVDFLIDGKVRWTEHSAPYVYGGDDAGRNEGYLITTWLSAGVHTFSAKVATTDGTTAVDTVRARVLPAQAPPSALAGAWTRTVTAADLAKSGPGPPPAGRWTLVFDGVGAWHLDPLGSGVVNEYDAEPGVIHVYAPIQMAPLDDTGKGGISKYGHHGIGGTDCTAAGPFGTYRWAVTGGQLTLTAVHDGCPNRLAIWEGVWTRSG